MAKVRIWPGQRQPPTFAGGIYYRTLGGQLVAQSKPRPRGRGGSPQQLELQKRFGEAARAIRYTDAAGQHTSRMLAEGYPQQPGDLLMQAMLGTIGSLHFTDGTELHSVAERDEVSSSLDLIARTEGDIMVRGPGLWIPASPGPVGYVWTSNGPGAEPTYQPAGGGVQISTQTFYRGNITGGPYAAQGHYFLPTRTMALQEFTANVAEQLGHDYKLSVVEVDATLTITAVLAESVPKATTTNTLVVQEHTLPAPLTIAPPQRIAVLLVRTTTAGNINNRLTYLNQGWALMPTGVGANNAVLASNDPAIGQTIALDTSFVTHGLFFVYRL